VRIDAITDGTSNTVLVSEIILVPDELSADPYYGDRRGRVFNGDSNEMGFFTSAPPNTTLSDTALQCASYPRAPCTQNFWTCAPPGGCRQFARSYHVGGVSVLLADGSIRFVSDQTAPGVWKDSGSRAGGEVPGPF